MKLRFIKATGRSYYVYRVFSRGGGTRLIGATSRDPLRRRVWSNNFYPRTYPTRQSAARALLRK